MKIHEYQAKELLRRFDVKVPRSRVARSVAEAEEAANEALDRASGRANGIAAITPERVIREGDPTAQILDVIDKDVDISMLVLAANPGPEGPGPLVSMMAQVAGSFPIPVVIVPGDLSDSDIDGLS